jgi:signal transduction histidine kinase
MLLEQAVGLVAATAEKRGIRVVSEYNSPETSITADPAQLKQVIFNIIMNALQAMVDGGQLSIGVDLMTSERYPGVPLRMYVITFRDSGPGIQDEHLDHIFDPFFTTKKEGTGLGLSISYGIIQQHGGDIEIESTTHQHDPTGHGTTVTIHLPFH